MQLQLYGKKIWVYRTAVDFRMAIDGLSFLVSVEMKQDARESIYIFFNRRSDKIKCLSWHRNGFVLLYKRLESGHFHFNFSKTTGSVEISQNEVGWLMAGLEWQKMRDWKELDYNKFS